MTTCLTFRGVPIELRDELKRRAKSNKRSLNAEGVMLLHEALCSAPLLPEKELLGRIDAFPKHYPGLTLAQTRAAVREGRK
jgi:plasmid stability protein